MFTSLALAALAKLSSIDFSAATLDIKLDVVAIAHGFQSAPIPATVENETGRLS
jgi:hypothetical protein